MYIFIGIIEVVRVHITTASPWFSFLITAPTGESPFFQLLLCFKHLDSLPPFISKVPPPAWVEDRPLLELAPLLGKVVLKHMDFDRCIQMDWKAKWCTKKQLIQITLCQIYIKTITILDIVTHDGLKIHDQYYNGIGNNTGHKANFHWPDIKWPPRSCWKTWKTFISNEIRYPSWIHYPLRHWPSLLKYTQQLEFNDNSQGGLFCHDTTTDAWYCYGQKPPPWHQNSIPKILLSSDKGKHCSGWSPTCLCLHRKRNNKNHLSIITRNHG